MKFKCIANLESYLSSEYNVDHESVTIVPELCPRDQGIDLTVNCYRLNKLFNSNPIELANNVANYLKTNADVESVECVKAFVNIALTPDSLYRDTIATERAIRDSGILSLREQKKILVEYSAPNTNKPQHLGHIRNNLLGNALCSLFSKVGHHVTAVNLINDRGIHICKSMIAYQRFGEHKSPADVSKKGDHFVGDFYVRFESEFRRQLERIRKEDRTLNEKSNQALFLNTEIGRAAQELLVAWERGNEDVASLWKRMNGWVLNGFDQTYQRMGITFDHVYYESDTYTLGKKIVLKELKNELFNHTEDGAVEIDLTDIGLDRKVVLRKDGTTVYITQDIGTTFQKYADHNPDQMMWIVGDEQIYHFKVLFAILRKMKLACSNNLNHIPYGMVNLPDGKMKSREGSVVDADHLFDEMAELARAATLERCGSSIPENIDERAEMIGMGAIKFMLLKVNAKTTMTFDPEASIKFEGDTGAYVQYAYARIASILRKFENESSEGKSNSVIDWKMLAAREEKFVALQCARYGNILKKSATDCDPACLTNYLLELTKDFNRFYKNHSVLSAENFGLKVTRLELCKRVQFILKDGLSILGIGTLEAM